MKKILLVVLACGFVFLNMSVSQASFLEVGDTIRFTGHGDTVEGIGTAGEFTWVSSNTGYTWSSFCVELNEHVSGGVNYKVEGLTNYADKGGIGGQDLNINDGTLNADSLDERTAWLFWNFTNNTLDGYTKGDKLTRDERDLQALIWYFEGELDEDPLSSSYEFYIANHSEYLKKWEELAENAVDGGWKNNGRVQVVNLGVHQDQLIVSPVPEPATMMLFGLGLLGLAGLGRKKIHK